VSLPSTIALLGIGPSSKLHMKEAGLGT